MFLNFPLGTPNLLHDLLSDLLRDLLHGKAILRTL